MKPGANMTAIFLTLAVTAFSWAKGPYDACAKVAGHEPSGPYNSKIMSTVHGMPVGGGYDAKDARIDALKNAVSVSAEKISVDAKAASPSFCSAGTYMVFLKVVAAEKPKLSKPVRDILAVQSKKDQPDGTGVWGRWNANGPGTAVLFQETGLGRNFAETKDAAAGDFLKIWWNDSIGKDESGHSVVFDSLRKCGDREFLCFWSENTKNDLAAPGDGKAEGGWGLKCTDRKNVKRTLFSRLENLDAVESLPRTVGGKNTIQQALASLNSRNMSPSEMASLSYKTAVTSKPEGTK